MLKVMFICTGNICRSAMAHAYLEYKLQKIDLDDEIKVFSAGTAAENGKKATEYANSAINEYGADLSNHMSVNVVDTNIDEMDYIIVMTQEHKDRIVSMYPEVKNKVSLLKEYSSTRSLYKNIDDPWGLSKKVYENCANEIVDCVNNLFLELTNKGK